MSTLKDLNKALKKASKSEKFVWDFILTHVKTASVDGVNNPLNVKNLLNGLEKIHGHLMNTETTIQIYKDLKISGFTHENVESLKNELQEFTKKINLDIQALKRK